MAAIGIYFGGNALNPDFLHRNKPNHFSSSSPSLFISNLAKKIPQKHVSASIATSSAAAFFPGQGEVGMDYSLSKKAVFSEKIDSWMQESVSDIVKNLKQAPLLVHVYTENDGANDKGRMKFKTETATVDKWPVVKSEWESGESKSPNGLIFVEELVQENDRRNSNQDSDEGVTKAWGVVVQEKGVECKSACYLLKTNRVSSGMGLGYCTHFCLMKVNNFRDSALEQFKHYWLLQCKELDWNWG